MAPQDHPRAKTCDPRRPPSGPERRDDRTSAERTLTTRSAQRERRERTHGDPCAAWDRCRGTVTPRSGVELRHDLVGDVVVREHVLHVVAVLEGVDQPEHLAGAVLVELDGHAGDEAGLGRVVVDAGLLQRGADGDQVGRPR